MSPLNRFTKTLSFLYDALHKAHHDLRSYGRIDAATLEKYIKGESLFILTDRIFHDVLRRLNGITGQQPIAVLPDVLDSRLYSWLGDADSVRLVAMDALVIFISEYVDTRVVTALSDVTCGNEPINIERFYNSMKDETFILNRRYDIADYWPACDEQALTCELC